MNIEKKNSHLTIVYMLILILLFASVSHPAYATDVKLPGRNTLIKMSRLLTDEITKDIKKIQKNNKTMNFPVSGVVVCPFVQKTGMAISVSSIDETDTQKEVRMAVGRGLMNKAELFGVRELDMERWKNSILREGSNELLINSKTAPRLSRGIGAKWMVVGEYWSENNTFFIAIRMYNAEDGIVVAAGTGNDTFRYLYAQWIKTFAAMATILILSLIGLMGFIKARLKKSRSLRASSLSEAVETRDIEAISHWIEQAPPTTPDDLLKKAKDLLLPVKGIVLAGLPEGKIILAPGPKQGIGRNEELLFSFRDPGVSRAPHAWVLVDNGRVFVTTNKGLTLINNAKATITPLENGDTIQLGDHTVLDIRIPQSCAWLEMKVVKGPDTGITMILLLKSANLGSINEDTAILPDSFSAPGEIYWTKDRPIFQPLPDMNNPLKNAPSDFDTTLIGGDIIKAGNHEISVRLIH